MRYQVAPLSPAIGAEVRGAKLSEPIDEASFNEIFEAWLDHQVLLFRGQSLSDAHLVAFSRRFGTLDAAPRNEASNKYNDGHVTDMPEVTVISNVIQNGVPIGALGDGESAWHTDMSYMPRPPSASILYGLETPPAGGDTGFANMYLAYETLPADLKAVVETHRCIHDATYTSAGGLRKGVTEVTDVRQAPGAHHPMVRTHPISGRPALFLGRRRNAYILGLPVEESERLLDRIWAHASQPHFTFHHKWRVGDVIMWDNRCVMHRRDSFDPSSRRVMHRTQVQGDEPVFQRT